MSDLFLPLVKDKESDKELYNFQLKNPIQQDLCILLVKEYKFDKESELVRDLSFPFVKDRKIDKG